MTTRRSLVSLTLALSLLVTASATTQQPAGTSPPSSTTAEYRDVLGDELPPGAIARLGSTRLRHAGDLFALHIDAAARTVLSSAHGDGVRRWSIDDGAPVRTGDPDPQDPAWLAELRSRGQLKVRAAQDGRVALVWSLDDGTVRLHRATDTEPGALPGGPSGRAVDTDDRWPIDACFDADAKRVLIVGERTSSRSDYGTWVRCLDTTTLQPIWEVDLAGMTPSLVIIAAGTGAVGESDQPASVGEPGQSAFVAGRAGHLVRLSLVDGATLAAWDAHDTTVSALAAGPAGALVTGSSDGELVAWDLQPDDTTATVVARWRRQAHLSAVTTVACAPSLGLVASGSRDRRVKLWSWKGGEPRAEPVVHATRLTAVLRSRDGGQLVSADWSGRLGLWQANGALRAWVDAHDGRVTGLVGFDDEGLVLSAGRDGRLALWQLSDGVSAGPIRETATAIMALAASDDGRHIASSGADGVVRLWSLVRDTDSRPLLAPQGELPAGGRTGFALAYTPGAEALFIGTSRVRRIEASDGALRWDVAVGAPVAALSVSPDGRLLAAALASRAVVVLDSADGQELWRWSGHAGRVEAVAFSPDGRRLAAAGGDASIRVRHLLDEDGDELPLLGHLEPITSLHWGEDGVLTSASSDGTALLWRP